MPTLDFAERCWFIIHAALSLQSSDALLSLSHNQHMSDFLAWIFQHAIHEQPVEPALEGPLKELQELLPVILKGFFLLCEEYKLDVFAEAERMYLEQLIRLIEELSGQRILAGAFRPSFVRWAGECCERLHLTEFELYPKLLGDSGRPSKYPEMEHVFPRLQCLTTVMKKVIYGRPELSATELHLLCSIITTLPSAVALVMLQALSATDAERLVSIVSQAAARDKQDSCRRISRPMLREALHYADYTRPFLLNRIPQIYKAIPKSEPASSFARLWAARTISKPLARSCIAMAQFEMMLPELVDFQRFCFDIRHLSKTLKLDLGEAEELQKRLAWPRFLVGGEMALSLGSALNKDRVTFEWIRRQQPEAPTEEFAGLLYGLGLADHLGSIKTVDVYDLLSLGHVPTSCAVLLGLSIQRRGRADLVLAKAAKVHIREDLSDSTMDVAIDLQIAALVSVGWIFSSSGHHDSSTCMFNEIFRHGPTSARSKMLYTESYCLAAGIALGLISMPKKFGDQPVANASYIRTLLDVLSLEPDQRHRNSAFVIPSTCAALAIMFGRSGRSDIADRIGVPNGNYQCSLMPARQLVLRYLTRYLIAWDGPPNLDRRTFEDLLSKDNNSQDIAKLTAEILYHGLCLAGTASNPISSDIIQLLRVLREQRMLWSYGTDYHVLSPKKYIALLYDMSIFSLSLIQSGTGDLAVFRFLREAFTDALDFNTGRSTAHHMALGFLFLGSGDYRLDTSTPERLAALLVSCWPVFDSRIGEDRHYFPPLRLLWKLAVIKASPKSTRLLDCRKSFAQPAVDNEEDDIEIRLQDAYHKGHSSIARPFYSQLLSYYRSRLPLPDELQAEIQLLIAYYRKVFPLSSETDALVDINLVKQMLQRKEDINQVFNKK